MNTKQALDHPAYVLIAANSGRMLAKAAQAAGFLPVVIDLCADFDTFRYAVEVIRAPMLSRMCLNPVITDLKARYPITCAVYGSGLENSPDSLELLAENFTVLGNSPAVFLSLLDKPRFFVNLERLTIPYPETVFQQPTLQPQNWLCKPFGGSGGFGIHRQDHFYAADRKGYWQKFQKGIQHSVLFLADGKRAEIIGFNEQWTVALTPKDEFVFSGIVNDTRLTKKQRSRVSEWVRLLTANYGLIGLNSLDFIQDVEDLYVLEINPRPPASMQLYDADLLNRHIWACQGQLGGYSYQQTNITGYQIVYAQKTVVMPDRMPWPDGAVDLPRPGSTINTAQPICSIIAQGATAEAVRQSLNQKQQIIENQLEGSDSWNTAPALIN